MARSLRKITQRIHRTGRTKPRARLEAFGGIVALDDPPATAFVDQAFMQELGFGDSPLWRNADRSGAPPLLASIIAHCATAHRYSTGRQISLSGGWGPESGR